jgi:hypothetical protein
MTDIVHKNHYAALPVEEGSGGREEKRQRGKPRVVTAKAGKNRGVCVAWAKGSCKHGGKCQYLHAGNDEDKAAAIALLERIKKNHAAKAKVAGPKKSVGKPPEDHTVSVKNESSETECKDPKIGKEAAAAEAVRLADIFKSAVSKARKFLDSVNITVDPHMDDQQLVRAAQAASDIQFEQILAENERQLTAGLLINEGTTQRSETWLCTSHLTKTELAYMKNKAPHLQILFPRDCAVRSHQHPLLAMDRDRAEQGAYRYLMVLLKKIKHHPGISKKIIDIGGNPIHHLKRGRKFIHSCNPTLSTADVIRNLNYTGLPNTCCCNALQPQCDVCLSPIAHLSVHSLYYLEPDDILDLCVSSTTGILVAVIHEFNDAYGSFACGEATYQYTTHETVSMSVRGNSAAYTHGSLGWMKNGAHRRGGHTLVWTKVSEFTDSAVYCFTYTTTVCKIDPPVSTELLPCLEDTAYYGKVMTGPLSEQGKMQVAGEIFQLPDVSLYSLGPWVLVYKSTNNVTMYAPKSLISEAALYIAGRARTPDNFGLLLGYMRHKVKAINLPPHMLSSTLMAASCLGFVKHIGFETSVLHGVIKPLLPVIEVHTDALKFKFRAVWNWKKIAAAVLVSAAIAGTAAAGASLLPVIGPVVGTMAYVAGPIAAVAGLAYKAVADAHVITPDIHEQYRLNRSSYKGPTRTVYLPSDTTLPGTKCKMSLADLERLEIDKSAKIKVPDITERNDHARISVHGITSTYGMPVLSENSARATASCLKQRALKPQPYHSEDFKPAQFSKFEQWVHDHIQVLFPTLLEEKVVAWDFTSWNSRFPEAQRAQQALAWEQVKTGDYRVFDQLVRKTFLKAECVSKSDEEGVTDYKPRCIQGQGAHANVQTGPYFMAYSARLKKAWDVFKHSGLVYANGIDAKTLGDAFESAIQRIGDYAILEGDFSSFDTTIHKLLLQLMISLHVKFGAGPELCEFLYTQIWTRGRAPYGITYEVDGTRHSGDQNTSCDNTTIQGLLLSYCIHQHLIAIGLYTDDDDSLQKILDIVLALLLGDDNLVVLPSLWLQNFDPAAMLLELGLIYKPVFHFGDEARYRATFCSSRFYPCVDMEGKQVTVLAPKLGRVIGKAFYYANPPPKLDMRRIVKGDARGRLVDCSAVPCLGPLFSRVSELIPKEVKAFETADMKRNRKYNIHSTALYKPDDRTYFMTKMLYNIGREEESQYVALLQGVKTLPAVVDFEPMRYALMVDGEIETYDMPDTGLSTTELSKREFKEFAPEECKSFPPPCGVSSPVKNSMKVKISVKTDPSGLRGLTSFGYLKPGINKTELKYRPRF